jgi:hypothetical protein
MLLYDWITNDGLSYLLDIFIDDQMIDWTSFPPS